MSLTYLKWPLIVLAAGFLVRIFGALIKILHWRGADEVLIIGTGIMALGIVLIIVKLLMLKNK